jgi:hypothetical protein
MPDSDKRTSLLHRGINYRGEMFIEQAPRVDRKKKS